MVSEDVEANGTATSARPHRWSVQSVEGPREDDEVRHDGEQRQTAADGEHKRLAGGGAAQNVFACEEEDAARLK